METSTKSKFPLVVIVGASFGGLEVAKNLANKPVEVLMLINIITMYSSHCCTKWLQAV